MRVVDAMFSRICCFQPLLDRTRLAAPQPPQIATFCCMCFHSERFCGHLWAGLKRLFLADTRGGFSVAARRRTMRRHDIPNFKFKAAPVGVWVAVFRGFSADRLRRRLFGDCACRTSAERIFAERIFADTRANVGSAVARCFCASLGSAPD
jgi:hypothetical protein